MSEQMKNNTVAFIFEGKLDDLLTDNGNIKSSRLIKFGNETEYGNEQNWDIQLTSYNNIASLVPLKFSNILRYKLSGSFSIKCFNILNSTSLPSIIS